MIFKAQRTLLTQLWLVPALLKKMLALRNRCLGPTGDRFLSSPAAASPPHWCHGSLEKAFVHLQQRSQVSIFSAHFLATVCVQPKGNFRVLPNTTASATRQVKLESNRLEMRVQVTWFHSLIQPLWLKDLCPISEKGHRAKGRFSLRGAGSGGKKGPLRLLWPLDDRQLAHTPTGSVLTRGNRTFSINTKMALTIWRIFLAALHQFTEITPTHANLYPNKVRLRYLSFSPKYSLSERLMPVIPDPCWSGLFTGLWQTGSYSRSFGRAVARQGCSGQRQGLIPPMRIPCCSSFINNDIPKCYKVISHHCKKAFSMDWWNCIRFQKWNVTYQVRRDGHPRC